MVVGAAQLGLSGADREAQRLLAAELAPALVAALADAAAKRQPSGSQAAAAPIFQADVPTADPFAGVGIEV
jgi:hypothetical protein